MTSDHTNTGARRFPTVPVIVAGLVGVALGAIAALAITGLVWTIRVELPPPPYPPPLSSTGPQGCLVPPAPAPGTAPTPAPGLLPAPPLPPR